MYPHFIHLPIPVLTLVGGVRRDYFYYEKWKFSSRKWVEKKSALGGGEKFPNKLFAWLTEEVECLGTIYQISTNTWTGLGEWENEVEQSIMEITLKKDSRFKVMMIYGFSIINEEIPYKY